jgi:MFS family permease
MSKHLSAGWLRLRWLSVDGRILLATKLLRTLAFGYLSVALPFYLGIDVLKLPSFMVGVIFSSAILGGVIFTLLASVIANKISRRSSLSLFALLITASGALLLFSTNIVFIFLAVFIGSIGVNATETGPSASIEQAMMPQTTDDNHRTYAFSVYNLLGYAGASFGSLLGGLPSTLHDFLGFAAIDGHRVLFILYALTGLALFVLYRSLSCGAEVQTDKSRVLGITRSKRTIASLSVLFSLDAFGGGFVIQSVLSYWFGTKYNTSLSSASNIFFFAQLITAASFLFAGRLAKKIGLLNTMVFTHLPSNVLLIGVALPPTYWSSIAFLFARQSLSQMDVPTRQSYMVAIIPEEERNAATSITNVSRTLASAASPSLSGYLIGATLLAEPFILAGAFKIVYDISIYFSFRNVKPPEEKT